MQEGVVSMRKDVASFWTSGEAGLTAVPSLLLKTDKVLLLHRCLECLVAERRGCLEGCWDSDWGSDVGVLEETLVLWVSMSLN